MSFACLRTFFFSVCWCRSVSRSSSDTNSVQMSPKLGPDHLSIISCQQCRQRKVKCKRQTPTCENCIKKGCICVYPQTNRKTSTRLTRKRKNPSARYYGYSSVNRSLFEVGMPFCNVDFELENKYASSRMRSTAVYKRYVEDSDLVLEAIRLMQESVSSPFFDQIVDLGALQVTLTTNQRVEYQTLLLLYAVTVLAERFFTSPPDVGDLVAELNRLLDDCPDCPEKVSSYILLADYYHYNFKIEAAWKRMYLATSIGYALGMHRRSSKVWTMLVYQDALLCSILGRPSSISRIDPQLIHGLCDGWGEIALLLREFNEIMLNLESENCMEKVISLDMKCDDVIERTRRGANSGDVNLDPKPTLLRFLKVLVMVSNRIKLFFPIFSKHRFLRARLDENCNSLVGCLCELFQLLTTSGLASKNNLFHLRPHFFPAYCCIFQGFLFQFLFTSSESLKGTEKTTAEGSATLLFGDKYCGIQAPSSLSSTVSLLDRFDYMADKISLCKFMTDVFESFRTLINRAQKGEDKQSIQGSNDFRPGQATDNYAAPLYSDASSESHDIPSPFAVEDIADWITSCFSDGIPYFHSADQSS